MTPFGRSGSSLYQSVVKAVIALIMKTTLGAPHSCMGTCPHVCRKGYYRYTMPLLMRLLFLSWAQSIPLSCTQICHIIRLLHLWAKPISVLLGIWRYKSRSPLPPPPPPAVSCLFILYYSTIWFLICSHCLLKTCLKAHHNQIYSSWSLFSFHLNYNFANLKDWMDLFEKEAGRDWNNWFLSVCKWSLLEMHMKEKSEAEKRQGNQLLLPWRDL